MKIGFIDYFLDEWHANNYIDWLKQSSGGTMDVAYAYAMVDSPKGGRTTAQWCADMGVQMCDTIEDVVALSDGLIVLSPDNAEYHEALCQLPLRSGKPTYVDKTFAPDGSTARRIFALAAEHGTPCYSASALRFAPEYEVIGRKGIRAITAWGPGEFESYIVHQLEPVMMLMQAPASAVQYNASLGWFSFLIRFADGRHASIHGYKDGSPFAVNVCSEGSNQVVPIESDYFQPFIMNLVQFFRSRHEPVSAEETLYIMDVIGAGTKAKEMPGTWVMVS